MNLAAARSRLSPNGSSIFGGTCENAARIARLLVRQGVLRLTRIGQRLRRALCGFSVHIEPTGAPVAGVVRTFRVSGYHVPLFRLAVDYSEVKEANFSLASLLHSSELSSATSCSSAVASSSLPSSSSELAALNLAEPNKEFILSSQGLVLPS